MRLKEKLNDLNNMNQKGVILETLDKYYRPDGIGLKRMMW